MRTQRGLRAPRVRFYVFSPVRLRGSVIRWSMSAMFAFRFPRERFAPATASFTGGVRAPPPRAAAVPPGVAFFNVAGGDYLLFKRDL